jgi:FtsP/CotA-like multicopper oxidase with cupredoxin domain
MADETTVYNYGFVGGRQNKSFTYQTSFSEDGLSGGGNASLAAPPAPTGGRLTGDEFTLQGNAQFPGPLIYASVGDVVELRLKNLGTTLPSAPNDPHSIHLHGLDVDVANDGVPETSVAAVPANLCDDGRTAPKGQNCSDIGKELAPGAGNVIVYMFSPKFPGTYMWHCHQEADIHVQMGMYGALVIYNRGDAAAATGPGMGKGGTLHGWTYDKDVVLLESEIDVRQHCAEQGTYTDEGLCPDIDTLPGQTAAQGGYNPVDYHPQFWFLNGLSFPNTAHVIGGPVVGSFTDWATAHPGYDPLIVGSVSTKHSSYRVTKGDKILLRVINMGYEVQPLHMHGYHGKVIGSDQRAWPWVNVGNLTPFGQGEEKQTLTVGSGETYEWLIDIAQQKPTSSYPAGTQSRYYDPANAACVSAAAAAGIVNPVANQPVANAITACPAIPESGDLAAPNTYIGGPKVADSFYPASVQPRTGSQFFVFHNHDDYKATNNGQYPGGMFTVIIPTP